MIFLTGFMGSGKTTVGKELASMLGRPFVDLDELISYNTGHSIPEIFECAGEKAFRFLEKEELTVIASADRAYVAATGGGLPVSAFNRAVMKSCGMIVHLGARFETLKERVQQGTNRPLWNEDARRLYEERLAAYEDADIIIDTDEKTPHDVAEEICSKISAYHEPIPVLLQDNAYPIYIGKGIFKDIRTLIKRHCSPGGIFVLADGNVLRSHRDIITEALQGSSYHIMEVPPGEESKSDAFLRTVLKEMFSAHVNRDWLCLGIGGGVTGDLAGFAASIFMRGIPLAHVTTTLLAQVDSGIGGKTAINNEYGKNLVGTFHQPLFVLSDVGFLSTLDEVHIKSALAEVIKYGIIMDAELFEYIENKERYDYARLAKMCARDKARVVRADEREGGLRRILNFGHTLGHAVERVSDYTVSHGQAVAVGMLFGAWVSSRLGFLSQKDMVRIQDLIRRERIIPGGIELPGVEKLSELLYMDKKATGGGIYFVLTPSIGNVTVKKLTDSQVLDAYKGFLNGFEEVL